MKNQPWGTLIGGANVANMKEIRKTGLMKIKLLSAIFLAILLASVTRAGAQTNIQSVHNALSGAHDSLVQAAAAIQAGDQATATAAISQAIADLNASSGDLADPGVQAALGKLLHILETGLGLAQKRTQHALDELDAADLSADTYTEKRAVIKSVKVAASSVSSCASLIKKPLLLNDGLAVLANPATAGFYIPG